MSKIFQKVLLQIPTAKRLMTGFQRFKITPVTVNNLCSLSAGLYLFTFNYVGFYLCTWFGLISFYLFVVCFLFMTLYSVQTKLFYNSSDLFCLILV